MTRICWCRLSQRWKAASLVSPTTRRSISLSPWANCDSSTVHSFYRPLLTSSLRQTSLERFRSLRGMSRPKRGANCLCTRASTHTSTWTPGSAMLSPNFLPRKPSSASFQTNTSAMRNTGMHSASAKPLGATTISTTDLQPRGLHPGDGS